MTQLTKCKCGNYLSDCSCVITKMDLINEPTMKEQEKIIYDRLIELNKNNGLYNCKLEALAKDLSDHLTAEQGEKLTEDEISELAKIGSESIFVNVYDEPVISHGGIIKIINRLIEMNQPPELTVREVSDEEIQSMANKYIESNRFIECANVAENSYIAGLENMRDKMNSLKS